MKRSYGKYIYLLLLALLYWQKDSLSSEQYLVTLIVLQIAIVVKLGFVSWNLRSLRKQGFTWKVALQSTLEKEVSPTVFRYLMTEARIFFAALTLFQRVPANSERFEVLPGSQYQMLLGLVVFGTLVELPLIHFLIEYFMDESTWKFALQMILGFLGLYGLIWFLGDYKLLKGGGMILDQNHLKINLSIRWNGEIPLENIEEYGLSQLNVADPMLDDWRKPKAKLDPAIGILKFGMEKPNIVLRFKQEQRISSFLGRERSFREVHFYLSTPDRFLSRMGELLDQ